MTMTKNMKRLFWILPLVMVAATVFGQRPGPPDPSLITVRVSRGAGPPAGRVSLPVSLTAAKAGGKLGMIELDLTFPAAMLAYTGAETAGLADGVSAALKAEVKPDAKDPATSHLFLSLSTLDSSRAALPDGTLIYLLFQISKDAKLKTLIPVGATGKALSTDNPPTAVAAITVQGNSVEVSEAAIISCFFYMH